MLQLPPMSTKKPRILLRIGPNRLATYISVPTDDSNLEPKASPSSSDIVSSGDMAATSSELSEGKASQKSNSRLPARKMTLQRQYKPQMNLRNLRNQHAVPSTEDDDTKESPMVTPPETATNSGTELKQTDQHEETHAAPKKRARKEPLNATREEVEVKPTKKPRVSEIDASTNAILDKAQEIPQDLHTRSLRSQHPSKVSDVVTMFIPDDKIPVYVRREEHIKIVDDEPNAVPRLVPKKPADGETLDAASSSNKEASSTPGAKIPAARSAPITTFDFSQFEKKAARFGSDPLKDAQYVQPHKKYGMKEKRWRNLENEKSQQAYHELKSELDRLKGPNWFKVLGLRRADPEASITRESLISSMEKEVLKATRWTEGTRKQKRASKADRTTSPEQPKLSIPNRHRSCSVTQENGEDDVEGERPSKSRKIPLRPDVKAEEKPFKSFFSKPHLRKAALQNWRKSGRHAQAFGHQLPAIPEMDFDFTFPLSMVEEVAKSRAS